MITRYAARMHRRRAAHRRRREESQPTSVAVRIELSWHQRLVDDMVDARAQWRHDCAGVQAAYDLWNNAAAEDEVLAFGTYEAALDEEERSSQVYRDFVRRVLSAMALEHEHDLHLWRALGSRMHLRLSRRRFPGRRSSDRRADEE
jgi:hypothetical protein